MSGIDNKESVLRMLCAIEDDEDVLDAAVEAYLTMDASDAIEGARSIIRDLNAPDNASCVQILEAVESVGRTGIFYSLQGRVFLLGLDSPSTVDFRSAVVRVLQLLALTHFVFTGTEITAVPTEFDVECALECEYYSSDV